MEKLEHQNLDLSDKFNSHEIQEFMSRDLQREEPVVLQVILKADTNGSLSALQYSIDNLSYEVEQEATKGYRELSKLQKRVRKTVETEEDLDELQLVQEIRSHTRVLPPGSGFKILRASVGQVSQQDIEIARATEGEDRGVILAFNVKAPAKVKNNSSIVISHGVIYHLLEDTKKLLYKNLPHSEVETVLGRAEVLDLFLLHDRQKTAVAGCRVKMGEISKKNRIRVFRDKTILYEGSGISSLQQLQQKVNTVQSGQDCGIALHGFSEFQIGDVVEAFQLESEE